MAGRFRRIGLRADELPGYRAAIIGCAREHEHDVCERLLGLLASLEARAAMAAPSDELSFTPPPGGSDLAHRALGELRAKPLRKRHRVRAL